MNRKDLGDRGEKQACEYLIREKGMAFIAANVAQLGRNETDLLMRDPSDGNALVFVEVKTRSQDPSPAAAVNKSKQAKLIKAALSYVMEHDLFNEHIRFDVMEVFHQGGEWAFNHIQDAFLFKPKHYFA